ncbi:hypothetical protein PVK06_048822 [Gossypium arboreum]|uniref:Uncharacterized protein n=1 Tax=Gossypium arboreum TaxID=29729 RepID=A0ABR0MHG2_GOSAR|nr:hypothetical protein PVK06_048822 [Gossypium arboreum]
MSTQMSTHVPTMMPSSMAVPMPISMSKYLGFMTSYSYSPIVSQTPTAFLLYRGGSSVQPPSHGIEDTKWKDRAHSSTVEDDGDKNEANGKYEDEDNSGDED